MSLNYKQLIQYLNNHVLVIKLYEISNIPKSPHFVVTITLPPLNFRIEFRKNFTIFDEIRYCYAGPSSDFMQSNNDELDRNQTEQLLIAIENNLQTPLPPEIWPHEHPTRTL